MISLEGHPILGHIKLTYSLINDFVVHLWSYYSLFNQLCVCVCVCVHTHVRALSHVQLFVTSWTVAHYAPLSMGFPRQEYWSGLSFPPPEDFPDPGIKPTSPARAGGFFTTEPPGKPIY